MTKDKRETVAATPAKGPNPLDPPRCQRLTQSGGALEGIDEARTASALGLSRQTLASIRTPNREQADLEGRFGLARGTLTTWRSQPDGACYFPLERLLKVTGLKVAALGQMLGDDPACASQRERLFVNRAEMGKLSPMKVADGLLVNLTPCRLDRIDRLIRVRRGIGGTFANWHWFLEHVRLWEGDGVDALQVCFAYVPRLVDLFPKLSPDERKAMVGLVKDWTGDYASADGEPTSMLGYVFGDLVAAKPLVWDRAPTTEAAARRARGLAARLKTALGVSGIGLEAMTAAVLEQFRSLAPANNISGNGILLTREVLSAFYRLANMARLLGIEVEDLLFLLARIGGMRYAGPIQGAAKPVGPALLDIAAALKRAVARMRREEIDVTAARVRIDASSPADQNGRPPRARSTG